MQAYKFDARISKDGIITLPFEPALFNRDVEIIVMPKMSVVKSGKKGASMSDFLEKWSGALKDLPAEDASDLRYEYLRKKYQIHGTSMSEDELADAKYNYLKERHK
ncbi:MAG: hypothetical protein LBT49_01895 [Prevotellaceae bacterium]|jgi:hypothetical protein|nr:hypothetical protein [Prevotellaceae bacterium]